MSLGEESSISLGGQMHRHSIHIKRIYTNTQLPLNNARETFFFFSTFSKFSALSVFSSVFLTFVVANTNVLKQLVKNDLSLHYPLGGWTLFLQHTLVFPGDALGSLGYWLSHFLPTSQGRLAQATKLSLPTSTGHVL